LAFLITPLIHPGVKRGGALIDLSWCNQSVKSALQHAFMAMQQQFLFQTCPNPAYACSIPLRSCGAWVDSI
jgi:hypothetical protein